MSNYNRESLRGFEEQVVVGAEVVNGTGEVTVYLRQEPAEDAESVLLHMTPEQVLDFARLLSQQAHEAMRAKWNEDNILHG